MDISTKLSELVGFAVRPGDPGLAVGIYTDGKLIHQASAGLASVEFEARIDTRTRFDIASMSKQFTATAALLLCRDGRLSLDDDIRTHLPRAPRTPWSATANSTIRARPWDDSGRRGGGRPLALPWPASALLRVSPSGP
ncbi:serine hydrolase domain-containing protein [Streptomyces sp. NPDC014872]|uniref:serine hydrolase domain-containing protein n=1 Tax=Streptomyces sp. NPDC014872 TaxID=3364926 RepID=UPI0036F92844